MKTKFYLLILFALGLQLSVSAQSEFSVRVLDHCRSDFGLSYNFFVGPDAEDFRTTIKGFGSGFLLDFFSARASVDVIEIGTKGFFISGGAGIAISKYRFSENLILENTENGVIYYEDPNPEHDYGTGFFSYGKSKLVSTTVIFPVNLNVDLGDFWLSAGGTVDIYLAAKHKRKFKTNDSKQKIVIKNDSFNDFPVNRVKYGIGAVIAHKHSRLNLGFTYMLTPFFEDGMGPEINEMRVSASYNLHRW